MVTVEQMSAAELRVTLDWLGLTQEDAAEILAVDPRTVRRWVTGDSPVPAGVVGEVQEIAEATAQAVDEVTRAIRVAEDEPVIVVYRTAEQMWAERPETRPYPASWWRMVAARALRRDTSGEARVVYHDQRP